MYLKVLSLEFGIWQVFNNWQLVLVMFLFLIESCSVRVVYVIVEQLEEVEGCFL